MAVRLVRDAIFDNSGLPAGEPLLFCLPNSGARALLSISEVLTYEATWIDADGNRVALTDEQVAFVDWTRAGLMEIEQVNEITAVLEEIRDELSLIRQAEQDTGEHDAIRDAILAFLAGIDPELGALVAILGGSVPE